MRIGFIKRMQIIAFNKKHNTNIHSLKASLKAKYGKNVTVSENVVISDTVQIGKHSYINRNSNVENCSIGNYCSISSGVWICPYEHHINRGSTHPFLLAKIPEKREKVIIGNDVLISLNSIILSGVHIGDGAVIAAGAVVTRDVKPFEVVGGVPAKHIKWRFSEERINEIIESSWWKKDIYEIESDERLINFMMKVDNTGV